MTLDPLLTLGGVFAGTVVGLTGLGGAAIVTPMLLLLFNSILVASSGLMSCKSWHLIQSS